MTLTPPHLSTSPKRRSRMVPAVLALVLSVVSSAGAADLEKALGLIAGGNAQQAYELLAAEEEANAGDPNFDYLLGLAALDSGQPGRAVFALERVLAVDPTHARARAEIARAYFQLGELETSRQEFEAVKQ